MATTESSFQAACNAIRAGKAQAHSLWLLLSSERDREQFALKPMVWEGPGQYQRVVFDDGRDVLVKTPALGTLPQSKSEAA